MITEVIRAIEAGEDILLLCAGLLRVCRADLDELQSADCDPRIWRAREELRARAEAFFHDLDDEELYPDEREELVEITLLWSQKLPAVVIAHTIAESLDMVLGTRLLPMFIGRKTVLAPGEPIPTPYPDWRRLAPDPNSDPWSLDGRLDAVAHLRLAGDWAAQVQVALDGDWRRWHVLPQLQNGDRLACALPNDTFDEFVMDRDTVEGRPVFFNARYGLAEGEQERRCLALLELARRHRCRIVAFPELSVSAKLRTTIAEWLTSQEVVDMVLAGSCHVPAEDGRWHNEAAVLIRGMAEPIVHRKFRSFSFPDPSNAPREARVRRHEYLAVAKPALSAQLSPHWTVVVLICKDALQEPIPRILGDIRANLVLVPVLSFKMDAFRAVAASIATWGQGVSLMANACVAPDAESERPPLVIGMPSQMGSVISEAPPPRSLLIVTIGSLTRKPSIVDDSGDS